MNIYGVISSKGH